VEPTGGGSRPQGERTQRWRRKFGISPRPIHAADLARQTLALAVALALAHCFSQAEALRPERLLSIQSCLLDLILLQIVSPLNGTGGAPRRP
jgi:hypothetical protein